VQSFVELPEKPTYSINSRSCFPADHIDRFLSYGLRGIQFGAPGSQYIVSGQFRPTHTPYKTLQDRRRRPSCETQNTPMSREHRDSCAVRNSPSPQNLGAQSSVGNTLPHWTFHCGSACTSQSLANAALFPILTCRVCMQFLIGPKYPYMEQATEHEPQPTQSSPRRWNLCECGRWGRSRHPSCTMVASNVSKLATFLVHNGANGDAKTA
jgi:hypothetical protein